MLLLPHIFHYSRRKLFLYLLFNLSLLGLALFFTWLIFPSYAFVYEFALAACVLSVLSVIAVIFIRHPLAVVTPEAIRIDFCCPLYFKDVEAVKKVVVGRGFWKKPILIFEINNFSSYKLNFMQRLIKNSEFSAFSIPLYAMETKEADAIESLLHHIVEKE